MFSEKILLKIVIQHEASFLKTSEKHALQKILVLGEIHG
jgi:hypothetical protein